MKNILVAIVVSLYCLVASASPKGTYLGLSAGWQNTSLKVQGSDTWHSNSSTHYANTAYHTNDLVGTLFVGYNLIFSPHMRLGLEISISSNTGSIHSTYNHSAHHGAMTSGDDTAKQYLKYRMNFSLLPTYSFSKHSQLFLRLGLGLGEWESDPANGFMGHNASTNGFSKTAMLFITGIGWKLTLNPHWSARLEGDYIQFNSFNISEDTFDTPPYPAQPTLHTIRLNFHPKLFQAQVAVCYDF